MATGGLLLVILIFSGCGRVHYQDPGIGANGDPLLYPLIHDKYSDQVLRLKKDLESLSNGIDEKDAFLIANTAIRFSMVLANQYELVRPPLWHNFLVNAGKKKRGICFDWRQDLIKRLRELDQNSFDFHFGIAYPNSTWRISHGCVIVSAKGQAFEDGIVLDPWRNSGRLYWISVKKDRYPWQLEPTQLNELFRANDPYVFVFTVGSTIGSSSDF
jgi:hypothetical protein